MKTTTIIILVAGGALVLFVAYMLLMRDTSVSTPGGASGGSNIFDAIGDGFAALPGTVEAFADAFRSSGGQGTFATGGGAKKNTLGGPIGDYLGG